MPAEDRRPVQVFSSRRRASTANSIGLDYTTGYRVEEDILSRIRKLLLSRNGHCPPRTPYVSDEDRNHCSEHCCTTDTSDRFDFSTATSIRRLLVRTESGGLAFPETPFLRSSGTNLRMDGFRRPTQPSIPAQKRSLRATSSTNDLSAAFNDAAEHETLLTCCPPCPPEGTKKTFRLPRLVLRERSVKRKRDPVFRSCIDFTPRDAPSNETQATKPDLPCPHTPSSRKSSKEIDPRRRLSGKTVKAEPADLACFLAGCGPGECKTHSRRSSQPMSPKGTDAPPSDKDGAESTAKLGLTVIAVNKVSGAALRARSESTSQTVIRRPPNESEIEQVHLLDGCPKSPTSSTFSQDTFPHAVQSQEIAAKVEQPLSSIVVTNFVLPGPRTQGGQRQDATSAKQFEASLSKASEVVRFKSPVASLSRIVECTSTEPSDASMSKTTDSVQPKKSDASIRSKAYSASLRSVSSKAASIRHALLKTPGPDGDPVDTALPVPPVLTLGDTEDPLAKEGNLKNATVTGSTNDDSGVLAALNAAQSAATEVVVHLTSLKNAKDLADRIKSRSDITEERPRDEGTAVTVRKPAKASEPTQPTSKSDDKVRVAAGLASKSITSLKGLLSNSESVEQPTKDTAGVNLKKPSCCPDPVTGAPQSTSGGESGKALCCPGLVAQPCRSVPLVDPGNAAYWGFVPAVKEAVQDAVHVAIRRAVEEITVPPGSQKDEASEVYRKLLGDSLAEAVRDADSYLRRASLWNEPPSSIRERSEGDLEFPDSTTADHGTVGKMEPGFDTREDLVSSGSASRDNLETVPLEDIDERLVENHKQGRRPRSTWNGLAKKRRSGYVPIPTRGSSKSQVLGSKNQTTLDSSVQESPEGSQKPRSKATSGLRSISSVESIKTLGSGDGDQADEQDLTVQGPNSGTNRGSIAKQASSGLLSRRNTVHWLRELLSTNGPYEPRFTALPPRTRRDEDTSTGRMRSQTAPAQAVTELYLGATPRPDQLQSGIANTGETGKMADEGNVLISIPENGDQQHNAMTQAFTKTINDLEYLLNEALFIARQAADREGTSYGPTLLGRAAAVLKGGRKGFEDDIVRRRTLKVRDRSRRRNQKRSDDVSGVPSMHESFGSFSSSDSEGSNGDGGDQIKSQHDPIPKLQLKTPTVGIVESDEITGTNHHDTGWAPAGRVATPFPPSPAGSAEQSTSQVAASSRGSPDLEQPGLTMEDINPFLSENLGNARKISQVSPTKRSRSTTGRRSQQTAPYALDNLPLARRGSKPLSGPFPMPAITPRGASLVKAGKRRATQTDPDFIKSNFPTESVPTRQDVREYITAFHHPPIQPRASSLNLRKQAAREQSQSEGVGRAETGNTYSWQDVDRTAIEPCSQEEDIPDPAQTGSLARATADIDHATSISKSYDGSQSEAIHFDTGYAHRQHSAGGGANGVGRSGTFAIELRDVPNPNLPQVTQRGGKGSHLFNLKGRNHISLRGEHHKGFSFARTHKKPKIARDWAPARKRFVATVACISTALVGSLVGVYAAEVPAIQYWIVDFHHYTILGNVFFFIGLSIPTFFFWPLPLLHGRKPYTLGAMSLAMPLLFPQALAVGQFRSPYVDYWRIGLIFPRALMGFVLGFANMNFKATLLDLFGASLQSENPHQEVVDENDVRRHGGGLGVWLGIWTWCAMGSIGIGFLIGAIIINHLNPAWGFYISIAIIAFTLFLNVLCPEVRRSAFRRSVAELKHEEGVSRRLGRGEVKMHMVQTGPKWWGEEFHYGVKMNAKMLRQPGFMVLAVYTSWTYAQIILLVVVREKDLLSRTY
jgi:serine/arginine repetitive matrix protein 2